jgi:transposase
MVYRKKTLDEVQRTSKRITGTTFDPTPHIVEVTSLPTAVMSWILDSIGFSDIVNTSVDWDPVQCKVSPGDALKSMILTMAMDAYRPALENVAGRFRGQPVRLLFDSVEKAADLDPDMLARALDKFHDAGPVKLFMTVSAALRSHFSIKTKAVHSDTTSVSVYGTYDHDDLDAMHITHGYSKDRRPDLRQFMIGDAVNESGIPIVSAPLDGNTSDHEWNDRCLTLLKEMLDDPGVVYVADSKLMTSPLVSRMISDGTRFLSRCPENFENRMQNRILAAVDPSGMTDMGTAAVGSRSVSRSVIETVTEFKGTRLRAVVVRSSALAGKGDAAVKKEEEAVDKISESFDTEYACEKDARKAFAKLEKKISKTIFDVSAEYVHGLTESRPRGRPRTDGKDIRRADRWTVVPRLTVNETKRDVLWRSNEMIVLISNVRTRDEDPENGMTAAELVKLYGNEWKVEAMFKTKKTPMMVKRIYLKTPSRAESLIQTVNIAALVRAVMQLLIRRGLEDIPDDMLPDIGYGMKRLHRNVTADFFTDSCSTCKLILEGTKYSLMKGTTEQFLFYSDLLGIPPDELFPPKRIR